MQNIALIYKKMATKINIPEGFALKSEDLYKQYSEFYRSKPFMNWRYSVKFMNKNGVELCNGLLTYLVKNITMPVTTLSKVTTNYKTYDYNEVFISPGSRRLTFGLYENENLDVLNFIKYCMFGENRDNYSFYDDFMPPEIYIRIEIEDVWEDRTDADLRMDDLLNPNYCTPYTQPVTNVMDIINKYNEIKPEKLVENYVDINNGNETKLKFNKVLNYTCTYCDFSKDKLSTDSAMVDGYSLTFVIKSETIGFDIGKPGEGGLLDKDINLEARIARKKMSTAGGVDVNNIQHKGFHSMDGDLEGSYPGIAAGYTQWLRDNGQERNLETAHDYLVEKGYITTDFDKTANGLCARGVTVMENLASGNTSYVNIGANNGKGEASLLAKSNSFNQNYTEKTVTDAEYQNMVKNGEIKAGTVVSLSYSNKSGDKWVQSSSGHTFVWINSNQTAADYDQKSTYGINFKNKQGETVKKINKVILAIPT